MSTTRYIVDNVSGQTINGQQFVPNYKVYTALLTQSGGDEPTDEYAGEDIYIGVTYCIVANDNNYDLTQYGAPNSNVGTCFVCNQTATLPGFWTGIQLSHNLGAPVVTVLENTIGNIWWTYGETGIYFFNSDGLFTENKTMAFPANAGSFISVAYWAGSNNIGELDINNPIIGEPRQDGLLYNTPIEIRVYN